MKNFRIILALLAISTIAQAQFLPLQSADPAFLSNGITQACGSDGGPLSAFPGNYTLALKIGDKVFNDKLIISYVSKHSSMFNSVETFSGAFISPEGQFESTVLNGKIRKTGIPFNFAPSGFTMAFDILVNENNETYAVYFQVNSDDRKTCTNEGTAYLDIEQTQELGKFTMTKDTADCDCATTF